MDLIIKKEEDFLYSITKKTGNSTVSSHLAVGEKSALVFDMMMDDDKLYDEVRKITPLPLKAVISHSHHDHIGYNIFDFALHGVLLYMFKREIDVIEKYKLSHSFGERVLPLYRRLSSECNFIPLKENEIFDLGGIKLRVVKLLGHSMEGCMLLEQEKEVLFAGDALGANCMFMQVENASTVQEFVSALEKVEKEFLPYKKLKIYMAHRDDFEIKELHHITRLKEVSKEILNGKIVGNKVERGLWIGSYKAETPLFKYGYFYRKERLFQ